MDLEDKNPHFHDDLKGCKIEPFIKYSNTHFSRGFPETLSGNRCHTHNIDTCRCGWEFGHHYGLVTKRGYSKVFADSTIEFGRHLEAVSKYGAAKPIYEFDQFKTALKELGKSQRQTHSR